MTRTFLKTAVAAAVVAAPLAAFTANHREAAITEQDNANREPISTLVGPGKKPANRHVLARQEITAVLAVGAQHPRVLEHAAIIRGTTTRPAASR